MISRSFFGSMLALCVFLAASPAVAQRTVPGSGTASPVVVRPEVRLRVERALLAIDALPPAAFWQGLGPEGLAALAGILDDASRPVGLRRRAVLALRHDESAASLAILRSLARAEAEDEIVSRSALRVLTEREGLAAIDTLAASLGDRRAHVREGAVLAIRSLRAGQQLDRARASALLTPAHAREQETFVRVAIEAVLAMP